MARNTEIPNTNVIRNLQYATAKPSNAANAPALYAFYIIDIESSQVERAFGFDIPPKSIEMDESSAGEAVPLQENGFYLDERGQYFKDVTITGTFGFRPTRDQSGGLFGINKSIDQISRAASAFAGTNTTYAPTSERTGFDRYRDLHNLIRHYWDLKGNSAVAAKYVFLYANWKLGEVYIVRPVRFRRSQEAPSGRNKILYSFQMQLIAPLNVQFVPKDFLTSPNNPGGLTGVLQRIRDAGRFLSAISDSISRTINSAIDFGFSVVNTILAPVNAFVDMIRTVEQGIYNLASFPAETLRGVHRACLNAAGILDDLDKFNDVSRLYKRMAQHIANVFTDVQIAWSGVILAEEEAKQSSFYDVDLATNYSTNNKMVPRPLASNTQTHSRGGMSYSGSIRIRVPAQSTIQGIAKIYLGSSARWKEIVRLNSLSAPYISPSGDGISVLRPGDLIQIPAASDVSSSGNIVDLDTEELQEIRLFGRDLYVSADTGDLEVDAGGDLAVVEGMANFEQGIRLKVWHSVGDLGLHRWYGFDSGVGEGVTIDIAARQYMQLQRSILADPRVKQILGISVEVTGDVSRVGCSIQPKNTKNAREYIFASK